MKPIINMDGIDSNYVQGNNQPTCKQYNFCISGLRCTEIHAKNWCGSDQHKIAWCRENVTHMIVGDLPNPLVHVLYKDGDEDKAREVVKIAFIAHYHLYILGHLTVSSFVEVPCQVTSPKWVDPPVQPTTPASHKTVEVYPQEQWLDIEPIIYEVDTK